MKKIYLLLLVLISVFYAGCNKETDSSITEVSNLLTSGTWRITYFWKSSLDKTALFTGYDFTFQSGGVLNAVKGSSEEMGFWSAVEREDKDNCDLVISFITQNFFAELSNNWHIIEVGNTKIRMVDESGSGGAEYLTIEKN